MSMKRYTVRNKPKIKEVISFENLEELGSGGFIVIILASSNQEDVNELIDEIGAKDIPVPVIVQTSDFTVSEVLDNMEKNDF